MLSLDIASRTSQNSSPNCLLYVYAEAMQQADVEKRDNRIRELSEQLAIETEAKRNAEEQRDDLDKRLVSYSAAYACMH